MTRRNFSVCLKKYLKILRKAYPNHRFLKPRVNLRTMEDDYIGAAYSSPRNVIEISRTVMKEVPFEAVEDVIIPHELAHIARDIIHPEMITSKVDHSKKWKDILKLLDIRKKYIDATYSMKDLKKYKR